MGCVEIKEKNNISKRRDSRERIDCKEIVWSGLYQMRRMAKMDLMNPVRLNNSDSPGIK